MSQSLPALIDEAARNLASARTAAEVLDARDKAAIAYDTAKRAARIIAARGAYDELLPKIHRAQADALLIESEAKRRLADEYDAAQARGEVAKNGEIGGGHSRCSHTEQLLATAADAGLTHKGIYEARLVRDAEKARPGVVRETVEAALAAGEEPSKAKLRRAVEDAAPPRGRQKPKPAADRNAARIAQQQLNAKIWRDLRDAIQALAGMPAASDVVAAVRATAKTASIVDHRLPQALGFLREFSDAWA